MNTAVAEEEVQEATGSFQERLRKFVALEKERRELEAKLEDVKNRTSPLQAQLIDDYLDSGMQRASVDGLTVYIRRDRFVSKRKDVETAQICEALAIAGRGDMVAAGYNAASLKSWILEQLELRDELQQQVDSLKSSGQPVSEMLETQYREVLKVEQVLPLLNVGEIPKIVANKS